MENKSRAFLIKIMAAISVLLLIFVTAYYLANAAFNIFGQPTPLMAYLLTCFIAYVIFWIGMVIVRTIHGKSHKTDQNEMLNAISQISQGNFEVIVDRGNHSRYQELAEAFNDMVRKLGSMEQLRQNFISDVSHEIQSPLTSISGFAALLKQDGISPEKISHYAGIIETESRRLSKLSDNLLRLSALEAGSVPFELKSYRLDKQLESIILMLEPQWSAKDIALDVSLPKTIMIGNEDLLSQVWINLLHNAIKFTPEKGIIHVALTGGENSVECVVADNGSGIAPEDQIHIFERFYKVDKSRDRALGGNGLGLSLVKKIVDMHKGQVTVKSEADKGTEFFVTLPNKK